MKRNLFLIVLFSVLTGLLITYFFFGKEEKKQFSWKENYKADSDQPYGTMFIRQLLESYRPGEKFIHNDKTPLAELLQKDSVNSTDYVFIGTELNLSEEDQDELLKFISSGNDAFVATTFFPYAIVDPITNPADIESLDNPDSTSTIAWSSAACDLSLNEHAMPSAKFNFYHQSLHSAKGYTYSYKPGSQARDYKWMALEPSAFCDSTGVIVALGHFDNDAVNFFRLRYGKGNLYIHTNPIAFTNYFMRMPDKAEYAAEVFSHLGGKTIIWDEYSRSQFASTDPENNPLALIMQHDSLKYAWWLMLLSALLYTVFTAKRKQRIVPVREEKINTSLEYVKMVSALHFENGNNKDIAVKKMKYFLYFIRAKYGVYSAQLAQDHFKRLSEKSQIDLNHIESIFDQYGRIEKNSYTASDPQQLMILYNAIDHFYKHCK